MRKIPFTLILVSTAFFLLCNSCDQVPKKAGASTRVQEWTQESLMDHIKEWPGSANDAAEAMIEKYGIPDEITDYRLIWRNKGDFKEIIAYREEVDHNFPMPHKDVLEQTISYKPPVEKFTEVAIFDGSVTLQRTKGTMSSRCDSEPMNYLALNLTNEVITGKKSVKEAREFYASTVVSKLMGEKPEYTEKLLFTPPSASEAGDPGEVIIDEVILEEIFGQR